MKLTWKTAAAGLLLLTLVVLILPQTGSEDSKMESEQQAAAEMRYKQKQLEQDLLLTESLCRSQCRLAMQTALQEAGNSRADEQSEDPYVAKLRRIQQEHPHMQYLEILIDDRKIAEGSEKNLPDEVKPYLEQAREHVKRGQTYESTRISTSDGPYFVAAIRGAKRGVYMIGAVKQQHLDQIRSEQRKNLRLVPYPSDARFGVQSADSDTLRKVKVDHPEENEDISHYYVHDVIVRFQSEPDSAMLDRILKDIDADILNKAGFAYIFRSRSLETEQLMEYFRSRYADAVHYVEPHFLYVTNEAYAPGSPYDSSYDEPIVSETPNDALYRDYQWNLPAIRTEAGWAAASEGEEVIVAVVDTGVDLNHPDLRERLTTGYNVYTEGSDAYDDVGHGTHVAGIIAAQINNYEGIAGVAPRTRIMPVKVLDASGAGSTYAVAQGIIWAADNGAQVINLSLGNYADAQFLHEAIRYAYERDVVLVAATGNDSTSSPGYPAAYDEVFAVGATDYNQSIAQFSNYGAYVDAAAPGVSIASTYPGSQYAALSGTSMASPHVAALASMIRSVNPALTNEQVMELMRSTAVDLGEAGHDVYYGYGQIDLAQAVQSAMSSGQSIVRWSENLQTGLNQIIGKHGRD